MFTLALALIGNLCHFRFDSENKNCMHYNPQKAQPISCYLTLLRSESELQRPGVVSDGNFSSYLIRRSGFGLLFPFPVGGNGKNTIYPLLSAILSTWTEPETCFG